MNKFFTSFFLILFFGIFVQTASAASLSFSAPDIVSVGETFSVDVIVSSPDRAFNASEATIIFPNDLLEVDSLDTKGDSTIFNFWLNLPTFSNEKGVVFFSGGTTFGTLGNSVKVITINFHAKEQGSGFFLADNASINASDGSGANILSRIISKQIKVGAPIKVETEVVETAPLQVQKAPVSATKKATTVGISQQKSNPVVTGSTTEVEKCPEDFLRCDMQFPVITEVSVNMTKYFDANIFVSGYASAGGHVHVALFQDEVPYKEVTAPTTEEGMWEVVLSNIHAYSVYKIKTWVESEDNSDRSRVFTWNDIKVYPPFTFIMFGQVVRWYFLLGIIFGTLSFILGLYFFLYRLIHGCWHTLRCVQGGIFIFSIFVLLPTLYFGYLKYQEEYYPQRAFWEETDIPCLARIHSHKYVHGNARVLITINGVNWVIPEGLGYSQECIAYVHTHDNTGRLHLHIDSRPTTIRDVFAVMGTPLERSGYSLKLILNGELYQGSISEYEIQYGDEIELIYTTIK